MVKFVSSFSFLSQYSEEIISFLHDQNIKGRSFEIRMEFAKQQMFSDEVDNFFVLKNFYFVFGEQQMKSQMCSNKVEHF